MSQYEEISLKELILLLLKGWKIIALSTVFLIMMATGVYFFGNQPAYALNSKATLSYSPSHVTAYGTFNTGLNNADDVMALIQDDYYVALQELTTYEFPVEDLKPCISFSVSAPNTLKITYTGLDEISLQNLQSNVSQSLSIYLSASLQDKAKKQFLFELGNAVLQTSYEFQKNQEIITLFESELAVTDMLLTPSLLNPAYASISSRMQDLKNTNLILEYSNTFKLNQIEELNTLDYEDTLPFIGVYADVTNDNTVIATHPYNAKTLFPIAFVLGLMVGFFIVLFLNYWKYSN